MVILASTELVAVAVTIEKTVEEIVVIEIALLIEAATLTIARITVAILAETASLLEEVVAVVIALLAITEAIALSAHLVVI